MRKQSSLKTGMQIIFLQVLFWGMDMLSCFGEDTKQLHSVIISGIVIILLMIIFIVFATKAVNSGIWGGLLFLLMGLSMGINKGFIRNNMTGYLLCWALAVAGTVVVWTLKERWQKKKRGGSIKAVPAIVVPVIVVPVGGIWGARWLLKSVGQEKAYWIALGCGIILELIITVVGACFIMAGICSQKNKNA